MLQQEKSTTDAHCPPSTSHANSMHEYMQAYSQDIPLLRFLPLFDIK